nr:MAG TPA: hypothetical protein [Caudoviricetes sp.]
MLPELTRFPKKRINISELNFSFIFQYYICK